MKLDGAHDEVPCYNSFKKIYKQNAPGAYAINIIIIICRNVCVDLSQHTIKLQLLQAQFDISLIKRSEFILYK